MYHIIICDDDVTFIQYMKNMIMKCDVEEGKIEFMEFYSGEALIEQLQQKKISECDLLILDMQMKKIDGDRTAQEFRKRFPYATLVFCSGRCFPTVESFKATPYRYLLKEYSDVKMMEELSEVIAFMKRNKREKYITCNSGYTVIQVPINHITYIELARRGSIVHLCREYEEKENLKELMVKSKLDELFAWLKEYGFVYAHNSYIVNISYIKKMTRTELMLADETILSIARSKEKELKRALAENLSKKY